MRPLALALALVLGCQGRGGEQAVPATGSAPRVASESGGAPAVPADATPAPGSEVAAPGSDEEPEPPDPGKAIAELGAIPAWQAVIDRAQYLARRGQHGVVYGTVGPAILVPGTPPAPTDAGVRLDAGLVPSPYVWLVDDTEGNGALAIRVELGAKGASARQGDRVALGGAWALDDSLHWFWKVDAMSPLPPAPPAKDKDPPSPPGHAIENGELRAGAHTISLAKDDELAYFQVVGPPPASEGDGWPVADELGNPVYALLNMPGERASYGAQDMRTADERWQLRRGVTYMVRLGTIHRHGPDKPATIAARTAPVKIR